MKKLPTKVPTKVNKEHSYNYWMNPNNRDHKGINKPQKIDKTELEKLNKSKQDLHQSAWNTLGTWEEMKFKVEDFIKFVQEKPGKLN